MLKYQAGLLLLLVVGFMGDFSAPKAARAEQPLMTAIIIGDMHCTDCAKKIASKLYAVPGVKGVQAEVKTGIAYVTPQQSKQPSPRALWEAVEAVNFTPQKLVGPYGAFTTKPQQ